jgi:hypothetical protein
MVGLLDAGYVQKDKKNSFHDYKYASDEGVTRKIRDAMRKNGLFVESCKIERMEVTECKTPRGETMQHVSMIVRFMLRDTAGTSYGPYDGAGEAMDKGDKATMKAMTAARKYAIAQSALVSWGDDPEADASVDELMEHSVADQRIVPNIPKPDGLEVFKSLVLRERMNDIEAARVTWGKEEYKPFRDYMKNTASERDWIQSHLKAPVEKEGA